MLLLCIIALAVRFESWAEVPLTLTVDDVAAILGVSRSSAYRLVDRKQIRAVRISERKIVVSRDELRRFLGLSAGLEPIAHRDCPRCHEKAAE